MTAKGDNLRVWSEVHIKVPVPGLEYTMFGFTFGHERLADGNSQEALRRAELLCDEFNEATMERRLKKLLRDVKRIDREIEQEFAEGAPVASETPKKKKGKKALSVQERARQRMSGK